MQTIRYFRRCLQITCSYSKISHYLSRSVTPVLSTHDGLLSKCTHRMYCDDDNVHSSNKNLEDMFKFLKSVYTTQKHGILSIESGCLIFCQTYRHMEDNDKITLLCHIAENYGVNQDDIVNIVKQFIASKERGEVIMLRIEERLRGALSAKYQILFSDIGRIEDGVKFLVDMRADILRLIGSTKDIERAYLMDLQYTLKDILALWFTVGFLNLERMTWQSSCDMLQKISEYEAVHPMRHWLDLKRRVGPYRRCFVFTHSSMPREPLVVLHCALTNHISSSIHNIIGSRGYNSKSVDQDINIDGPENRDNINTAIFYSVTSTQKGLQGVDLGNYLIKRVASELKNEWPQITQFSSLSPIPGFRDWLIKEINTCHAALKASSNDISQSKTSGCVSTFLSYQEVEQLCNQANISSDSISGLQVFHNCVTHHTWVHNKSIMKILEAPLMRLCARYLYLEKRRGYSLNSVGNFHLQNGAVLWRINWMGDTSLRGLNNSCGLMVNYRYYLEDTINNSQRYIEDKIIQASDQVKQLCVL